MSGVGGGGGGGGRGLSAAFMAVYDSLTAVYTLS